MSINTTAICAGEETETVSNDSERPRTISETTRQWLMEKRQPAVTVPPVSPNPEDESNPIISTAIIRQEDVSFWLKRFQLKNPQSPHCKAAIDLYWRSETLRVDLHALLESIAEGGPQS